LIEAEAFVRRKSRAVSLLISLIALMAFGFVFYPDLKRSVDYRINPRDPFLSSRPPRRLTTITEWIKRTMKPGERLLYEEGGFDIPDAPDPFLGGRYSGLLPHSTGIEVLGGPYLHASLLTNFTQFGENTLFGKKRWGRDHFVRYATLYRPVAIACWSPWAKQFCRENPDLVEIGFDDGVLLLGRIRGFGGLVIQGKAEVQAVAGKLQVLPLASGVDGKIVLRYHSVPTLRSNHGESIEPVVMEDDPVPFIGLKESRVPLNLRLDLSP
jgi:hypothetical protein